LLLETSIFLCRCSCPIIFPQHHKSQHPFAITPLCWILLDFKSNVIVFSLSAPWLVLTLTPPCMWCPVARSGFLSTTFNNKALDNPAPQARSVQTSDIPDARQRNVGIFPTPRRHRHLYSHNHDSNKTRALRTCTNISPYPSTRSFLLSSTTAYNDANIFNKNYPYPFHLL